MSAGQKSEFMIEINADKTFLKAMFQTDCWTTAGRGDAIDGVKVDGQCSLKIQTISASLSCYCCLPSLPGKL